MTTALDLPVACPPDPTTTEAARAFLPAVVPLRHLAPPLDRIVDAAGQLPQHYHRAADSVRPWLDARFGAADAAVLSACARLDEAGMHAMLSALGVLCHAYRWEHARPRPDAYAATSVRLPIGLAEPWQLLSRRAGIPRVGTLFHMVLNNWRQPGLVPGERFEPEELRADALEVQFGWLCAPESAELSAFLASAVLTEAFGVATIQGCLDVVAAVGERRVGCVAARLTELAVAIERLREPFRALIHHGRVRPETFLQLIQPTFVWGIDEGDGVPEGAAGPQLGVFHAIDALLGTGDRAELSRMVLASRAYMLPRQRQLLADLDAAAPAVREFLVACRDLQARTAFNRCVVAMERWRNLHRARSVQYLAHSDGNAYASSGGGITHAHERRSEALDRLLRERIADTRAAVLPGTPSPQPAAAPRDRSAVQGSMGEGR